MKNPPLVLALLWLLIFITRPAHRDMTAATGSITEAMSVLGTAGTADESRKRQRGFEEGYQHWDAGNPASVTRTVTQTAVATPPSSPSQPPAIAGIIGLLSLMGLHEVSALWLYLLADEAEDNGDYELQEICLRATPMLDPHFVEATLILAFVLRSDHPDQAETVLLTASRWNPEDWEIWNDLAWLALGRAGDKPGETLEPGRTAGPGPLAGPERPARLAKARTYLEHAMAIKHPYFVTRLYALVLQAQGEKDAARKTIVQLLSIADLPSSDRGVCQRILTDIDAGRTRL